jgi:preprotein translocase subunit SecG
MSSILLILIILICVVLSFFVLIQNPKGGGMSGTFGGFGNSVMGAKQSSEGVEKATWYSMLALAAIVLLSFVLMPKSKTIAPGNEAGEPLKASTLPQPTPQPAAPAPTPVPAGGEATTPVPQPTDAGAQPTE